MRRGRRWGDTGCKKRSGRRRECCAGGLRNTEFRWRCTRGLEECVREATEKELLRGEVPVTQFGRMCERLKHRIIAANSPQAKGRVGAESRDASGPKLVKKLRRKKIQSYEAANEYLEAEYLAEHNDRSARATASGKDYHRNRPSRKELMTCSGWRPAATGNIASGSDTNLCQPSIAPICRRAVVLNGEDGKLEIRYGGRRLCHEEIATRPATQPAAPAKPRQQRRMPAPPRPATHGEKTIAQCGHKGERRNERRAVGNDGTVESEEIQRQDFPSSHRSLEISPRTRDSHIPTAPATRPWKSGKPKTGFPLSHSHLSRVEQTKTADCVGERKGDTSIEVRMGTFLTRLDIHVRSSLTSKLLEYTLKSPYKRSSTRCEIG